MSVEFGAADGQLGALFAAAAGAVYPGAQAGIPQRSDDDGAVDRPLFAGSFLIGPGLASNVLLKENWGRPRPNSVQQFAGAAPFQPWWRPGGTCKRNCSFVSGAASQAFWTMAPASLAPPQIRPIALSGAVVFGAAVGSLRVVFGRERVSVALHRLIGAALGGAGQVLAGAGSTLRSTGQHLHKRVACL
jgi:lipid A 4'-phosphatase